MGLARSLGARPTTSRSACSSCSASGCSCTRTTTNPRRSASSQPATASCSSARALDQPRRTRDRLHNRPAPPVALARDRPDRCAGFHRRPARPEARRTSKREHARACRTARRADPDRPCAPPRRREVAADEPTAAAAWTATRVRDPRLERRRQRARPGCRRRRPLGRARGLRPRQPDRDRRLRGCHLAAQRHWQSTASEGRFA